MVDKRLKAKRFTAFKRKNKDLFIFELDIGHRPESAFIELGPIYSGFCPPIKLILLVVIKVLGTGRPLLVSWATTYVVLNVLLTKFDLKVCLLALHRVNNIWTIL